MSKKLIITILLIIALVGVGVVVYQALAPAQDQPGKGTPTADKIPASSEIDTSNWETYRNEEFGFEFRHPQGWLLKESREPSHSQLLIVDIIPESFRDDWRDSPSITFEIGKDLYKLDPDFTPNTTVGGFPALESSSQDPITNTEIRTTIWKRGDHQYLITATDSKQSIQPVDIFSVYQAIVNSFTLID